MLETRPRGAGVGRVGSGYEIRKPVKGWAGGWVEVEVEGWM